MKSIFTIALFALCVANTFAVPFSQKTFGQFLSNVKDPSQHESILKYIDSVECVNEGQKISIAKIYCQVLANQKNLLPFNEYIEKSKKKIVDLKLDKITPATELKIIIPWYQKEYAAQAFEYIKMQPIEVQNEYDMTGWFYHRFGQHKEAYDFLVRHPRFLYLAVNSAVKLKDDNKIFEAATLSTKYQLNAIQAKYIVDAVCKNLVVSDVIKPEDVKILLQKLNRKFVTNLAINKKDWEPIVVQLQIALKVY